VSSSWPCRRAVFANGIDPREAVARANALLDETAPRFEG
jgi:thiamine-phosphate pyrophosphorylase